MLRDHGIGTVRDALRWHLIKAEPGRYDWSSLLPMLHGARQAGVQVIWIFAITAFRTTWTSGRPAVLSRPPTMGLSPGDLGFDVGWWF